MARRSPLFLAMLACALLVAVPAESGAASSETSGARWAGYTQARFASMAWKKAPADFGARRLESVIGEHTVVVVPQTIPGGRSTSRKAQRRILERVATFWARAIPGMSLRFVLTSPVKVASRYCSDVNLALETAAKANPEFDPDVKFNHLAAVVDCGFGEGIAEVAPGMGRIMVNGWLAESIAHEFGHNLGLRHSNAITCGGRTMPKPGACRQAEYDDVADVMGSGLLPLESMALHGLWRAQLVGVRQLPRNPAAHVALRSMGPGERARPLAIPSRVGTLLVDAGSTPLDEACDPDGVEIRVVTSNGVDTEQGLLTLTTLMDERKERLEFLDAVDLPGTSRRLVVTGATSTNATVSLQSSGDLKAPTVESLPSVPAGPVPLTETGASGELVAEVSLTLPRNQGVLGYLVDVHSPRTTQCTARLASGRDHVVVVGEGVNTVTFTPVGTNGVRGEPFERQIEGRRNPQAL